MNCADPGPEFLGPNKSGLFERAITRWLMRPARVSAIAPLSAHFRFIDFEGEALKDCAWAPGQKIQIKLDGAS
jgi:ferric-chelate reductase (NADPH)